MSDTLVCILTVTSLGVTIYIDYICGKISKNINIMVKLRPKKPQKQHLLVCIILLYILTLLMLVHYGEIIVMLHCLKL